MSFNEQQSNIWNGMIKTIDDYRSGKVEYYDLVYGLEGALDSCEFKNNDLAKKFYDYWTPLEILSAQKGNNVSFEEVYKYLLAMESFIKSISDKCIDDSPISDK